jgi:hypothetical protein
MQINFFEMKKHKVHISITARRLWFISLIIEECSGYCQSLLFLVFFFSHFCLMLEWMLMAADLTALLHKAVLSTKHFQLGTDLEIIAGRTFAINLQQAVVAGFDKQIQQVRLCPCQLKLLVHSTAIKSST